MDDIDIEKLRKDLIDYFGSAMKIYPMAIVELGKIKKASLEEIIKIAKKNHFNLDDYKVKRYLKNR